MSQFKIAICLQTGASEYATSYFIFNDFDLTGPLRRMHADIENIESLNQLIIFLLILVMDFFLPCFCTGGVFFNGKDAEITMH